jgi:alkylated DNA repair protein (DNA oxidative demethylase)
MSRDLFDGLEPRAAREPLGEGACVLRDFARPSDLELLAAIDVVVREAPFRHLITPGGHVMSVAMTNCGPLGWVSDARGYRYDAADPDSGRAWPPMPAAFRALATRAASEAGFERFDPDCCLVNRYAIGTRLSLHQDRGERDFAAPIVSVSLGLPATFLWGGLARTDRPRRIRLAHGDVVVFGGADRLRFHGILPLEPGDHARVGQHRLNLTFRRVL